MLNIAPTFNNTYRANGLVTDLLDNFLTDPFFNENDFQNRDSSEVKIIEEAKKYIIGFPVPGYNRHSLLLEIAGNVLIVRGNKGNLNKVSQPDWEHSEKYSQLYSYTLPQGANAERVKAVCRNGLLEVHVAKLRTSNKPKVIRVTDGTTAFHRSILKKGWSRLNKRWGRGISLWRKLKHAIKFRRGRKRPSSFVK